jgi:hypothetical protein
MIRNFEYFTYGLPEKDSDPVYALYQPVLDRFLIVLDHCDLAKKLSALLLSRYSTYVCCVSAAGNYVHNIIDNQVCDSWTLSNSTDCDLLFNSSTITVGQLIPATNTVEWNVDEEKKWILFCIHWIKFFDLLKTHGFRYYQTDAILANILPKDHLEYYPHELERKVMSILFFDKDVDEAGLKITKLIDETNHILRSNTAF